MQRYNYTMKDKELENKKWYPDIERTKKNVHGESVLERSLGSQKATFIVSPEWISEGTHEAIPSPRRRHEPWSYEYPGAKVRKTGNQVAVEKQMRDSLKQLTPRV